MAVDLVQIAGPWVLTVTAIVVVGGLWMMLRHMHAAPPDASPSTPRVARGIGWR